MFLTTWGGRAGSLHTCGSRLLCGVKGAFPLPAGCPRFSEEVRLHLTAPSEITRHFSQALISFEDFIFTFLTQNVMLIDVSKGGF